MAGRDSIRGATAGLIAAALFGASAPLSKMILPRTEPVMLAALLYLGAGAAITVIRFFAKSDREARLQRSDRLPLAGIIVFGGIAGPVLMLTGLSRVSALGGSLLLNFEAPFTMVLALLIFGEHLDRRAMFGAALIVAGGFALSYRPGELHAEWLGALALIGACAAWGIDNNLSQRLSLKDPLAIVQVKALSAGAGSLAIALALGQRFPDLPFTAGALVLGAFSYGVSLLFDMRALRLLGAAREAAYFATAPFIGAMLAVPLLSESPRLADWTGGVLMVAGVALLRLERHGHAHTHQVLEHEHVHLHDEHHQHAHDGPFSEPHSHVHRHDPITHDHPHVSDVHHRHGH